MIIHLELRQIGRSTHSTNWIVAQVPTALERVYEENTFELRRTSYTWNGFSAMVLKAGGLGSLGTLESERLLDLTFSGVLEVLAAQELLSENFQLLT